MKGEYKKYNDIKTVSNTQAYSNMFSQMYEKVFACASSDRRVLPFSNTYKEMFSKNFDPLYQHDGHMFLMYLLDQLQAEETPVNTQKFNGDVSTYKTARSLGEIYEEYFKLNPSCIDRFFTGLERSTIKCINCNHDSITYKPFQSRSLSHAPDLESSLRNSFAVTQFDEDNKYKCEKCGQAT